MCMFIVWYPIEFSRLHNLHPLYWNSLLYGLISSGENSAHFLQLLPFTILNCSFHQVPITAGWTELEAAWYEILAQHLYTWPATWASVTHPSTNRARHCLTPVIWRELVTTRPCATGKWPTYCYRVWPAFGKSQYFLRLKAEVLCTPNSTWLRFELMTSRSWEYFSCHWDTCSNHSAIRDFHRYALLYIYICFVR